MRIVNILQNRDKKPSKITDSNRMGIPFVFLLLLYKFILWRLTSREICDSLKGTATKQGQKTGAWSQPG
jgi:hypothetical protein